MSAGSVEDGNWERFENLLPGQEVKDRQFKFNPHCYSAYMYLIQATLILTRAVREARKWILTMYKQCHVINESHISIIYRTRPHYKSLKSGLT